MEYDKVKDSGARQHFSTGAVRDIQTGKGRYDLIPAIPLRRLARHYENGSAKYGDWNWSKGMPVSRFMNSAIRHLFNYMEGDRSEDHLSAAVFNIFAVEHEEEVIERGLLPKELYDIPNFVKAIPEPIAITEQSSLSATAPSPDSGRDSTIKNNSPEPPVDNTAAMEDIESFLKEKCVLSPTAEVTKNNLIEVYNAFVEKPNQDLLMQTLANGGIVPERRRVGMRNLNYLKGIGLKANESQTKAPLSVNSIPVADDIQL